MWIVDFKFRITVITKPRECCLVKPDFLYWFFHKPIRSRPAHSTFCNDGKVKQLNQYTAVQAVIHSGYAYALHFSDSGFIPIYAISLPKLGNFQAPEPVS